MGTTEYTDHTEKNRWEQPLGCESCRYGLLLVPAVAADEGHVFPGNEFGMVGVGIVDA